MSLAEARSEKRSSHLRTGTTQPETPPPYQATHSHNSSFSSQTPFNSSDPELGPSIRQSTQRLVYTPLRQEDFDYDEASSPDPRGGVHFPGTGSDDLDLPPARYSDGHGRPWFRRPRFLTCAGLVVIGVILAVFLPIYFTLIKPDNERVTRGKNGSVVLMEDGTSFVYLNNFGGEWVDDPDNPFDDSARPNSWTPALNFPWSFEKNRLHGVGLAGLFVLEPLMTPALFQRYPGTKDEWSLSLAMAADTANGGLKQLEDHYNTFITEKDIADIAGAGLTWVKLPIGYWAIETYPGEPFLAKTSWKYIVRVLQWCRKYGLRVNLVLAEVPGGQNGYAHAGKDQALNFLYGPMGLANAQRTLYYIRIILEFIAQPEWINVVPMFTVVNEPLLEAIGIDALRSFYVEAHRLIRSITSYGLGHGPYVVFHDGFSFTDVLFNGFMNGADRVILDKPAYSIFESTAATNATISAGTVRQGCESFGPAMNASRAEFGITVAGEYTAAFLDCGLFVLGVNSTRTRTYTGDCTVWENADEWGPAFKESLSQFVAAQMDAVRDGFFWTWKIGQSQAGKVEAPLWSYQLGLQKGWINPDPRKSVGLCQSIMASSQAPPTQAPAPSLKPWNGTYAPWMTGGTGAGAARDAKMYPWPPKSLKRLTDAVVANGGLAPNETTATVTSSLSSTSSQLSTSSISSTSPTPLESSASSTGTNTSTNRPSSSPSGNSTSRPTALPSTTTTRPPTIFIPTYTPTGPMLSLPTPTFTDSQSRVIPPERLKKLAKGVRVAVGQVWASVPVAGCEYPNAWADRDSWLGGATQWKGEKQCGVRMVAAP